MIAAADGSSLANPGPSGWAWYIDESHWAAGGWPKGTNNMGELMSVLDLLRATKGIDEPLRILCDSQYAINCCTRWIPGWKKRGWRKADNKPVLNVDLLQQLDVELTDRKVTFQWVKGHAGHPLNERADDLARAAATAYQHGTPVKAGPGFSGRPVVRVADAVPTDTADDSLFSASPEPTPSSHLGVDDAEVLLTPAAPQPLRIDQPDLLSVVPPIRKPERVEPDRALIVDITQWTRELMSDEAQLDRERLDELMHPDYVVHMPNGTIRTKGSIIARPAGLVGPAQLDIMGADTIGNDVMLLRYRMRRNSEDFLCVALWQRSGASWRVRFQQFTKAGT
jgi:ribonuclease HI